MKEAAGEANITIITIVLIAIVLAVGTVIVNSALSNTANKSCCTSLGGEATGNNCKVGSTSTPMSRQWRNINCPSD